MKRFIRRLVNPEALNFALVTFRHEHFGKHNEAD